MYLTAVKYYLLRNKYYIGCKPNLLIDVKCIDGAHGTFSVG